MMVGAQSMYYVISAIVYLVVVFGKKDKSHSPGLSIFLLICVIFSCLIGCLICIGIFLLLKLHYKLLKFDFTTYEYIQYQNSRKDRLKRLKKKQISKEKFDELEQKARNKELKKRSKIIKEVTEENEQKILQKFMKKKQQMENKEMTEESKVPSNSNSMLKVPF